MRRLGLIVAFVVACGGDVPAAVGPRPAPLPALSQSCQVELDSLWVYAIDLSARMDAAQAQIVILQSACGVNP